VRRLEPGFTAVHFSVATTAGLPSLSSGSGTVTRGDLVELRLAVAE
jgi:hypothetical protein